MKTLELLTPTENTCNNAVNLEEQSLEKMGKMINSEDFEVEKFNCLIKYFNVIGKMRVNERTKHGLKFRVFKSISENKEDLKEYMNNSFPEMLVK